MILEFKGREKTHWTETRTRTYNHDGQSHTETYVVPFNGKHVIAQSEHSIYEWPSGLPEGDFTMSFSYVLPPKLPGVIHYSDGTTKADITYKLKSKLVGVGNEKIKSK